jgi:hypothetical protein
MGKIETRIDSSSDFTLKIVEGKVTAAELLEEIEAYYAGEITQRILWDFSRSSVEGITSDDMARIVEVMTAPSQRRKGGKTAFVSASPAAYGLGRMYQILHETRKNPVERRVFRTREEAMGWLGIPVERAGE